MYKRNNKTGGFTLIELLVVISIITLLSSVVFTSLGSTRVKARNAVRSQNILTLRNAFQMALADGKSPPPVGNWSCLSTTCDGYGPDQNLINFLVPYLPNLPVDPVGGDTSDGTSGIVYYLWTDWGFSVPPGAYLLWWIEPPGNCAPGGGWSIDTCLLKVDN